jgi:GWxTD domain-containing protein
VILNNIDISELPSGKFEYIIELRDKTNNLVASQSFFFIRSNPEIVPDIEDIASISIKESFAEKITSFDTLSLMIRSLAPISSEFEKMFAEKLIDKKDLLTMQQYLLQFWSERDRENPEQAFRDYMQEVAKAEKFYSTSISRGFETDRGRVYLQYGAPNVISENYNEPNNLPYEIWQYYRIENQGNVRFIFYTKDRSTNDFVLIHSTALGEVNNYRWRFYLRKTDTGFKSIDNTGETEDDWGSQINTNFNNPR